MRFLVCFAALICAGCGGGGGGGGSEPVVPGADPTFGDGGLATVNFGGGLSGLMAVARQTDGKIVGFGGSRESIALVRVHPDGSVDTSFGVDGVVQLPWGVPTNGVDKSHGIAIQPDGKILVTTRILGVYGMLSSQPIVARFTRDGVLDTTFASTGYVLSDANRDLRSIALQTDGKIVAGGYNRLERFLADGTRDTTFGTGTSGVATVSVLVQDLALQADGKIVTAGARNVARFTSTGAPDLTFAAPAGMVTTTGSNDVFYSVAVAADGKILAGGSLLVPGATDPRFAIARYDMDGLLDAGFGSNGIAHDGNTAAGGSNLVGLGIAPDGKIVGVGFANVGGTSAGRSARFDANGVLDPTFGGSGAGALLDMVAFSEPVFDPDGAVIAAGAWFGTGSFQGIIGRTTASGAADATFGAGGTVGREIGGSFDRANHLALQSDGSVIVSGWSADGGGVGVIRLGPDGAHDTTFGLEGIVTGLFDADLAYVSGSVVLPDDRILFTGPTYQGGFSLVRLDASGLPDPTFGTEGVVRAEPIAGMRAVSRAIAEGPDGSIYVAGEAANGTISQYAVTRFSADGVRDMTFGGGGAALSDFTSNASIATHLVVQPDGKPVTFGLSTALSLVRFDEGGAIDPTFGSSGRATIEITPSAREPYNLLLQPDGKLVAIVGNFTNGMLQVVRFDADGQRDASFGTAGVATFQLAGGNDYYYLQASMGAALLPDGGIVIGLAESSCNHLVQSAVLLRTLPDGLPDESFGEGGVQTFALGRGSSALHAITLQPDGKLLVAGRLWSETGGSDFAVLRLIP